GSNTSGGMLSFSQSSLTFQTSVNGSSSSQSLTVSAAAATNFSVVTQSNGSWLSISPPSGSNLVTPQTFTVTANPAGLGSGQYNGSILFTANGITQTVPVTLNIGTAGQGTITTNVSRLDFSSTDGSQPGVQPITVTPTGGNIGFTVA